MKKLINIILVLASMITFSASAKTVKCQVDNPSKIGDEIEVPVVKIRGPLIVEDKRISFYNHRFSVIWQVGDEIEPQSYLQMRFDGHSSTMYDFTLEGHIGPVNSIDYYGLRFECYVK